MIAKLSEKEIDQIAKETFGEMKGVALFMTNKSDLEAFFSIQ